MIVTQHAARPYLDRKCQDIQRKGDVEMTVSLSEESEVIEKGGRLFMRWEVCWCCCWWWWRRRWCATPYGGGTPYAGGTLYGGPRSLALLSSTVCAAVVTNWAATAAAAVAVAAAAAAVTMGVEVIVRYIGI